MWSLKKTAAASRDPEGQMELIEHLAELRIRIFRSICYVILGMVLTYSLFGPIYHLLSLPLLPILEDLTGSGLVIRSVADAFLLRMQVSLVSGLVVALPLVTLELWGFIAPALTEEERRPVVYLAPFSVLLFLSGVGTAYACLPTTYAWMGSYVTDIPGAKLFQDAQQYLVLTVKLLLAFGIAFQLPLVLLFLARVGILSATQMGLYWRHAVVAISVAAAILTPSNDPLTMLMMAIPMAGLYLLSIVLVRAFEPKPDGSRAFSVATMLAVSLMPIVILAAVGFWLWRMTPPAKPSTPAPVAGQADTETIGNNVRNDVQTDQIQSLRQEIQDLRAQVNTLQKRVDAPPKR